MSCVWICLNLLCAATYSLQSCPLSEEGMSVTCPKPVGVEAGQSLTINCSVHYKSDQPNCTIKTVQLNRNNITEDIPKNGSPNYVLLNVSNVTKSNNWTLRVITDCGLTEPCTVEVEVSNPPDLGWTWIDPEQDSKAPTILGVCVPLTIFVLFLFGIIFLKHIKRKNIEGAYTLPDSPSSPDYAEI